MAHRLIPALALLALSTSCNRARPAPQPSHPLEFGIEQSPTANSSASPWVDPADRSLRAHGVAAQMAFLAGFPDPIGRRYAQCGSDVGWVVPVPDGQMILDWTGTLHTCDSPGDTTAPFPGERFANVRRARHLSLDITQRNALTRALIVRSNIGIDGLTNAPREVDDMSAVEAWAAETWRVALANYIGQIERHSAARAVFFARVSLGAIGAYERYRGSTRGNPRLWFAPMLRALLQQLERPEPHHDSGDDPSEHRRDVDEPDASIDAGPLNSSENADGGVDRARARAVIDTLLRRRTGSSARLRERYGNPPESALEHVSAAMIERIGEPVIIEPLLEALREDERFVPVRITPSEHPERERPARVFELAYPVLATALAIDPIFEAIGADGVVRSRPDALAAHRAFVSGDRAARLDLARRFRERIGSEPLTRASLARLQLSNPSLGAVAAASARRLPGARARMPADPARRAEIEQRMRADAELLVRRADALFEQNPVYACGVLVEVERVAPGFQSPSYASMVDRFATQATPTAEQVACVGRVLRPKPNEDPSTVERRYAQWIERIGSELYSASPCDTIAFGSARTASVDTLRAHAISALEELRTERTNGGILRALVRWVRPEALRCAVESPSYRDWARLVLARNVPLGFPLTRALRDGEPWSRRRCPEVHEQWARYEGRIALRDLAGIAYGFAETREPCATAARTPPIDAMRFALEAATSAPRAR